MQWLVIMIVIVITIITNDPPHHHQALVIEGLVGSFLMTFSHLFSILLSDHYTGWKVSGTRSKPLTQLVPDDTRGKWVVRMWKLLPLHQLLSNTTANYNQPTKIALKWPLKKRAKYLLKQDDEWSIISRWWSGCQSRLVMWNRLNFSNRLIAWTKKY